MEGVLMCFVLFYYLIYFIRYAKTLEFTQNSVNLGLER